MTAARLVPVALRLGALATAAYAAWRLGRAAGDAAQAGRLDQQAEDALDALDEGVAVHRSQVLGDTVENRQTNATLRLRRKLQLGARTFELDASAIARLRLRRV